MKRILCGLLLISGTLSAQKIEKDEVDKFDGGRTVNTSKEPLARALGVNQLQVELSFSSNKTGINYYITFWLTPLGVISFSKDNQAFLKLEGGDVVKLQYAGDYKIHSGGEKAYFFCSIQKEQLDMLINKKVTDVRIESSSYNHDYPVNKKLQGKISDLSKLITEIKIH